MTDFTSPAWLIWTWFGFTMALMVALGVFLIEMYVRGKKDYIIFIDKDNRFSIERDFLSNKDTYKKGNKEYQLIQNSSLLNRKGRSLTIFSVNKPTPMKLEYNKHGWLSAESLKALINNKQISQIVKPKEEFKDIIIILGAIGGMIAGLSATIVLLMQTGVIGNGGA